MKENNDNVMSPEEVIAHFSKHNSVIYEAMQEVRTELETIKEKYSSEEGNCGTVAWHVMELLAKSMKEDVKVRLCHGAVTGQGKIQGLRHWHAWVEVASGPVALAVDFSNGKEVIFDKSIYRAIGQASNVMEYDLEQMLLYTIREEHYGPWDSYLMNL